MIDTHCHLLPLCDDGPESWPQALALAAEAASQGIKTIIATPHHMKGQYRNGADKVAFLSRKMNSELANANIPLHVLPGQELHLGAHADADTWRHGIQLLAGSKYLLVELPSRETPASLPSFIRECRAKGIVPVIAHPERHAPFSRDPEKLYEFISAGALSQLTAPSLVGHHGFEVQQLAFQFARKQWAQLLASDAHNIHKRSFRLKEAYWLVESLVGRELADRMKRNAEALVAGKELSIGEPAVPKQTRGWWPLSFKK